MNKSIRSLGVLGVVLAAGTALPVGIVHGQAGSERPPAVAKAAPPGPLTLKTERVVAFKDGYALIVKSATGTADGRGLVYTDDVPDAVLGCFWATSDQGGAVPMRAQWVEDQSDRTSPA